MLDLEEDHRDDCEEQESAGHAPSGSHSCSRGAMGQRTQLGLLRGLARSEGDGG
jgi:hypothetical protein